MLGQDSSPACNCGYEDDSLAAAKTRFSALVEEAVATYEQIVVIRNGEPAVVVLAVEDFESLLETLAIPQDPADRAKFERARREAQTSGSR